MIDGFLGDIMVKRGLYDFVTLCDTSNNTPTRIDRNELHVDIALKPVKAVEFIYIPIRVLSTGAKMS
jgi:phage tail sheath protein FI